MADDSARKYLLTAAEIEASTPRRIKQPFNPNSDVTLRALSRAVGLARVSLTLARVPPGKESFIYHAHERDEEFVYILSGRGRAEIGDEVFEVGPGDFMGFPTPSVAHHLVNPYDEDLVYLMGGEHSGLDISIFPRIGKRIVFTERDITCIDDKSATPMTLDQWVAKG
jgi:uncharacterized cupin superfamily protein